MRLSLLSLSSFFLFSFSILAISFSLSRAASFALCNSLAASLESECRLRRELDFSKEGKPRLSTEDFFPGVDTEAMVISGDDADPLAREPSVGMLGGGDEAG